MNAIARVCLAVPMFCSLLAMAGEGRRDEDVIGDLIRVGRGYYQEGKMEAALGRFQEVIRLDSTNRLANHYLGRIQARLGRFREAVDTLRKLQALGVSLIHEDMRLTLEMVINGILESANLKERGDLLIHLRETIRGLPLELEQQIDAHLMAVYAKLGEQHLHDIVKTRFFRNKPIPGETYFLAAKTYLVYDVNLPLAASYFEQAIDALRGRTIRPTGNPERDQMLARRRDAEATVAEDFLAYTYYAGKVFDPGKNRFVAAEHKPKVTFSDVTEAAGLKGIISPRVAVGDYDGDGYEDLFAGGRIFKNLAGKSFRDVTKTTGVETQDFISAAWLDYDKDGHLDLLIASFPKIRLWRNQGNGTFADATTEAGLDYAFPGPPEAIAVADYDGDGHLDIFIGCFEHPDPKLASVGQPSFLFHNSGKGRFQDVSQASGLARAGNFCTRSAAWGDFNNDGRPDLYVSNYRLQPNQLWVNQGGGKLVDEARALGVQGVPGFGQYAMAFGHSIGCAWGDIDNDGTLDLAVANLAMARFLEFADPFALYRNGGAKEGWRFTDGMPGSGIRFQEMATEVGFCDADNDGDLDLLLTAIYKERPVAFYQNVGDGKFQAATWRSGLLAFKIWGMAWFDKDNDGDMDLVLGSAAGIHLFENQLSDTSWLRVRLVGKKNNSFGIGARITVTAGALKLIREVQCGSGSQGSLIAHFGLGGHKGTADITVRWPDGQEQAISGARSNQLLRIEEP